MKQIIALQQYSDKHVSLYEGEIRNLSNQIADRLIEEKVVALHGDNDSNGESSDPRFKIICPVQEGEFEVTQEIEDYKLGFIHCNSTFVQKYQNLKSAFDSQNVYNFDFPPNRKQFFSTFLFLSIETSFMNENNQIQKRNYLNFFDININYFSSSSSDIQGLYLENEQENLQNLKISCTLPKEYSTIKYGLIYIKNNYNNVFAEQEIAPRLITGLNKLDAEYLEQEVFEKNNFSNLLIWGDELRYKFGFFTLPLLCKDKNDNSCIIQFAFANLLLSTEVSVESDTETEAGGNYIIVGNVINNFYNHGMITFFAEQDNPFFMSELYCYLLSKI